MFPASKNDDVVIPDCSLLTLTLTVLITMLRKAFLILLVVVLICPDLKQQSLCPVNCLTNPSQKAVDFLMIKERI
jgi:hypothetical protein